MNLNNTYFPYPVISPFTDAYNQKKFDVAYKSEPGDKEWKFDVDIVLEDDNLLNLIHSKRSYFFIVIECPSLGFRKNITSHDTKIYFELSSMDVSKKVDIKTYIIANENLNLASVNFHTDYQGGAFKIEKADVLGIAEGFSFIPEDDIDSFKNLGSIIHVCKFPNGQVKPMEVGLDGSHYIIISLSENDYQLYISAQNHKPFAPILISMLVVPALLHTLNIMMTAGENHEDKIWHRVILKRCCNLGYEEDPKDWKSPLEIIQKIVEDRLSKGLFALRNIREEEED
jgi:hypothetical protein